MTRHSSRLLAFLVLRDIGCEVHSLMLSIQVILCLPLALFPSTFPSIITLHMLLWRCMWPKYFNFLILIFASRSGFVCMMLHTSLLVFISFQLILPMRLRHHISKAFIFFSRVLVSVQVSDPYMKTE